MEERHSIQEIIKIYETGGSHPLLVTCDDLQDWVCKYDRATLNLFNEFLAYRFGQLWELRMPEIAQITIHEQHIPTHQRHRLQPHLFQKKCFGSKFLENTELIDLTTLASFRNPNFRKRIANKADFLKIALFDLWLANEDRHYNNFNMLLEFDNNRIYFICPIDHVMLFNSAHLDYEPVLLTDDESIINTPLAQALFSTDKRLMEYVEDIMDNFYLCTHECEVQFLAILSGVPQSWDIDVALVEQRVRHHIFSDEWKKQCETQFRTLIQQYLVS